MTLEYCSLVISPNGILSRSAALSNLTSWYLKVDSRMPWWLKVASPFKRMSHAASFNVENLQHHDSLCSASLYLVAPPASYFFVFIGFGYSSYGDRRERNIYRRSLYGDSN